MPAMTSASRNSTMCARTARITRGACAILVIAFCGFERRSVRAACRGAGRDVEPSAAADPAIQRQIVEPNGGSVRPSISADGRRVAFESLATNWVTGDCGTGSRIIVFDRQTRRAECASGALHGQPANGLSHFASISGDGEVVVFASLASNLTAGDTNGVSDVFCRDLAANRTICVSQGIDGATADGPSFRPRISLDGRYVVFQSAATNLVADDTNCVADIFLFDRRTSTMERVSIAADGQQADLASSEASVSADGRRIAFVSHATNLVPGDANGKPDVFVRDRAAGRTWRASQGPGPRQADNYSSAPRLSADGSRLVFESWASNLVESDANGRADLFLCDLASGGLRGLTVGPDSLQSDEQSHLPDISGDGRRIAFFSFAGNLAAGSSSLIGNVYLLDMADGAVRRLSESSSGRESGADSDQPSISADGLWVAFASKAADLTPDDANKKVDVFVYSVASGKLERIVPTRP